MNVSRTPLRPSAHLRLTFVNRSDARSPPRVAFWHDMSSASSDVQVVTWMVVEHCARDWRRPFSWPLFYEVTLEDSNGNHRPAGVASGGEIFAVTEARGRRRVERTHSGLYGDNAIEVRNEQACGPVRAVLWAWGRMAARSAYLACGASVRFAGPQHTLWAAVDERAVEARAVPTIEAGAAHALMLPRSGEATIVLTGGGAGSEATAFAFHSVFATR